MIEDRTRDLPDARSFEERVLEQLGQINNRLSGVENRLTTLEDKVERRLMETRPIWEAMQAQLNDVQARFNNLEAKTDSIQTQLTNVESKVDEVQERLTHIDSKVGSIDVQMGELAIDLLELRGDYRGMQKRIVKLEKVQPQP